MPLSRLALVFAVSTLFMVSVGCEALVSKAQPPRPHAGSGKFAECVDCHRDGKQGAPVTDHHKRPNCCERCHAPKTERKD